MARVEIVSELCKSCGYCIKFCPKKVLDYGKKVNSKGYEYVEAVNDGCVACCSCARMCPAGAINVYK
ncbi:MAG: ferredoxin family protein [Firmicutes bacterium]|nr:ferredoxin family protein [Bacillota bacterium]